MWGNVESVWGECRGCEELCWGMGGGKERCRERCGRVYGEVCWGVGGEEGGVGKCAVVWGEIREDVGGVKRCGKVYGVSGKVCIGEV